MGVTPVPHSTNRVDRAARRGGAIGVTLVVVFWWLTTGVLLAAQRSDATRVLALVATSVLAIVGGYWIAGARTDSTPAGVTRSFFGGAMLWFWVAATLYGGWIVGVSVPAPAGDISRLALASQAIAATIYNDVLGLLVIAVAFVLSRGGTTHTGAWTVVTFWSAHQIAKLNVFAGVAHAGSEYLPPYLDHLRRYFGPEVNSPLLGLSIMVMAAAAVALVLRARRDARPAARRQSLLLAALIALALLEHVLLGIGTGGALWTMFVVRGRV